MTQFFNYEDLTYPEVADLPCDIPLVIPLGTGYSFELVAQALSSPPRIGLLPPIPFGWRGSMLAVADSFFAPIVKNLIASLRDDGFMNVFALTPPGLNLDLGSSSITMIPVMDIGEQGSILGQNWPAEEDIDKTIFIPIGHTEQHGHHLPLNTDSVIIDAIAKGVIAAASKRAAALPVMPYGVSTHRQAFAGTLNVGGRAFEDFWLAVVDQLVWRGCQLIYLISGHGGNCSFLVNIAKYAGERHRRIFCATTWLYLSGVKGIAALAELRSSETGGMGHAGELETALMLHLRPELVHMDRVIDEIDFISTPSYYMDWVEGGSLVANPPWDDDTATGAYGAGSMATARKGELWLQAAIDEKIDHVDEIIEQQQRRETRRRSGYGLWGKLR
jgi:creatinine amidohydrolase